MFSKTSAHRRALLSSVSAATALCAGLAGAPAHAVVVNNNLNPNAAPILQTGVNGVGQMNIPFYNAAGVFTGFATCTGTLINPRTVIFAAHCVNDLPAGAYGVNSGGQPIAFFFNADNVAPLPGGGSTLNNPANNYINGQFNGTPVRGPRNRTSASQNVFNANQIFYDPRSLQEPRGDFLEADIALATLDTPAKTVPTWTLLFSPLTAPTHMTLTGYGRSGTGTVGDTTAVDFRRRAAENILQSLISFDDEDRALFGNLSGTSLPQDVYFYDFDDPARGTAQRNANDFDIQRDTALTREGATAGGDSGGPLIIDQRFNQPVVAGVLSGSRSFTNVPSGSYGERSFYQPLFLFWDVIVANNPYRYVSANAGDGEWFDPTRWTQQMDPSYGVIENGQLRNGLPTTSALGVSGATVGFGNVCNGARCVNFLPPSPPTPTAGEEGAEEGGGASVATTEATGVVEASSTRAASAPDYTSAAEFEALQAAGAATAPLADGGEGSPMTFEASYAAPSGAETSTRVAETEAAPAPPAATTPGLRIAGGPGSTGFTPNNTDGNRLTGARANYYDVTLGAAGVTTLGANANAALRTATVDRLTVSNTGARLNITSAGALTSLMDTSLFAGTLNVDGRLTTPELFLMAGLLSGSGTIQTDFLTSVMGTIAPGGIGAVGTMTVGGNLILSSGSQLAIDIASRPTPIVAPAVGPTSNDLLRTTAGGTERGNIVVGGLLSLNLLGGFAPNFGDLYTVVSATAPAGGGLPAATVTGTFSAVNDFAGVLRPELVYTSNAVQVRIGAASFLTLTDPQSQLQTSFGRLLDTARADPAALESLRPLFTGLDVLEGAALRTSLESLAPYSTVTTGNLVRAHAETFGALIANRTHAARESRGGVSVTGSPMAMLAMQDGVMTDPGAAMNDADPRPLNIDTADGVTGFIAGGVLEGRAAPLINTVFGGEEELQSAYLAAGVERALFPGAVVGGAVGYARGEGEYGGALSQVELDQVNIGAYAGYQAASGLFFDGQASLGWFTAESVRTPFAGATQFRTEDENHGTTGALGVTVGHNIRRGGVTITPVGSVSYDAFSTNVTTEGPAANAAGLTIRSRDFQQLVARGAVKIAGDFEASGLRIRPSLKLGVARDVMGEDNDIQATLTGAPNALASFQVTPRDESWYEAAAGVAVQGERVGFHLQYAKDFERDDLELSRFTAAFSLKF